MNKKGFTLVELLVYMAIIGIVVVVAGQAFSNSTEDRIRTQNMLKANAVAEQVGLLLRDDLAQMGAKSSVDINGFERYMNATISEDDSSSFDYQPGNYDKIKTLRVVNDTNGAYQRVEEVTWYVGYLKDKQGREQTENPILFRSCKTRDRRVGTQEPENCPESGNLPIQVADGVTKFKVTPATPNLSGGDKKIFPENNNGLFRMVSRSDGIKNIVPVSVSPQPDESAETVARLSGFVTNYQEHPTSNTNVAYHQVYVLESGSVSWHWYDCARIPIKKGATYEISFSMPVNEDASRMFRPGKDHFAVGIRDTRENLFEKISDVPDVLVYPPQAFEGNGVRKMRFSSNVVKDKSQGETNVCIVFTFATFSPLVGMGALTISDLKVKEIADDNYSFNPGYNPKLEDKPFVRAFKLELQVTRYVKSGKPVSGEATLVAPVPSNGLKVE